jgi:hypothetical protein
MQVKICSKFNVNESTNFKTSNRYFYRKYYRTKDSRLKANFILPSIVSFQVREKSFRGYRWDE